MNYIANDEAAEQVVQEIQKSGTNGYAHKADVSHEEDVKSMSHRMVEESGTIDILVNNAGLQRDAPFHE